MLARPRLDELCSDVLTFDLLLGKMTIQSTKALACVNRSLRRHVLDACATVRHLPMLQSEDLEHVLDTRRFSALSMIEGVVVNSKNDRSRVQELLGRWTRWAVCHLHTRSHSRRALHAMMSRMVGLVDFALIGDERYHGFAASSALERAYYTLIRHNRRTLRRLRVENIPPFRFVRSLSTPSMVHLSLSWHFAHNVDLGSIIKSLPPSVRTLTLENRSNAAPVAPPTFLMDLQRRAISSVHLLGCVIHTVFLMRHSRIVDRFCRFPSTTLEELTISALRSDHIENLRRGGLKMLTTSLVDRDVAYKSWMANLPASFRVVC